MNPKKLRYKKDNQKKLLAFGLIEDFEDNYFYYDQLQTTPKAKEANISSSVVRESRGSSGQSRTTQIEG